MAMLLTADGNHRPIRPKDDRPSFTLQELHAYVGVYIEVVAAPPIDGERMYLVLNEDGKRAPLPYNGFATFLFHVAGGPVTDSIVGDVVFCSRAEMGEDDDDLDDDHGAVDDIDLVTAGKVLDRLVTFGPPIIAAYSTVRCRCIAATALGIDVLQHFGVTADPLPVVVEVHNAAFVAATRRGADPVTAIARGGHVMVTSPEKLSALGWGGHLLIHVPQVQVLIDLDFQQFGRPREGITADPAEVLPWPTGTTTRQYLNPINRSRLTITATDDYTFRAARDWYDIERRRPAVDAVIRAITKNRLHVKTI